MRLPYAIGELYMIMQSFIEVAETACRFMAEGVMLFMRDLMPDEGYSGYWTRGACSWVTGNPQTIIKMAASSERIGFNGEYLSSPMQFLYSFWLTSFVRSKPITMRAWQSSRHANTTRRGSACAKPERRTDKAIDRPSKEFDGEAAWNTARKKNYRRLTGRSTPRSILRRKPSKRPTVCSSAIIWASFSSSFGFLLAAAWPALCSSGYGGSDNKRTQYGKILVEGLSS